MLPLHHDPRATADWAARLSLKCIETSLVNVIAHWLVGESNPSRRLERAESCPIDERAKTLFKQWAGKESNLCLLDFTQALDRLSYRPKNKKRPGVACVTPGLFRATE